eukprot:UN14284
MKKMVKDDEQLLMDLFFGLMGFFCIFVCWPLILILHITGIEEFQWPHSEAMYMLIINAVINMISDYTWARSILLTSPLVATIGLTLTVPVAMVSDSIIGQKHFSFHYYMASGLVLIGFFIVND